MVFFKNSLRIYHTGIVENVTADQIHTIEGNTSGTKGVVANGGGVWEKSYDRSYERIAGYGRPDWSLAKSPDTESAGMRIRKGGGMRIRRALI